MGKVRCIVGKVFRAAAMVAFILSVAVVGEAGRQADRLLTNAVATRRVPTLTPKDFGLPYREVAVTTGDGLRLSGWYVPGSNGALVILQHGYKSQRGEMLHQAQILAHHGYALLISSIRGHDRSDGERISFGLKEMADMDAWFRYAQSLPGVSPDRIGLLGNSLGGVLAIQYAAANRAVRAVVAHSAFSSLADTIALSVRHYTGLPPFPFAPLIRYWAEYRLGSDIAEVDATRWIGRLSPRPVLLLQGGQDRVVQPGSGERLYVAAGQPKFLWYEPALGHAAFDSALPEVYERRVAGFLDCYLEDRSRTQASNCAAGNGWQMP